MKPFSWQRRASGNRDETATKHEAGVATGPAHHLMALTTLRAPSFQLPDLVQAVLEEGIEPFNPRGCIWDLFQEPALDFACDSEAKDCVSRSCFRDGEFLFTHT